MINSYLRDQVIQNFLHTPTESQFLALNILCEFLLSREKDLLFLLTGYAGTGKTSLVGALVKTLSNLKQSTVLLAPTGRAAKVFSAYAGQKANTIHRKIYRQKTFGNENAAFTAAYNGYRNTLFVVDEASMISNGGLDSSVFGSGRLLDDLIHYIYSGENCRLLLMGDMAQLPPVTQSLSPALNVEVLKGYGLSVFETSLTQVVRQDYQSGILLNATMLRDCLRMNRVDVFPKMSVKGFDDLCLLSGEDLIDAIASLYDRDGLEETMVITRSNKRVNIYNNGIRNRVLYREEELSSGDRLMVVKNNYFWKSDGKQTDFIANGELLEVLRVRHVTELYGFRFADVLIRFQNDGEELEVKILLDTLHSDSPALPREANDHLFSAILEDYTDISSQSEKMKKIKVDAYYNALQVKYAYAMTCHKAQGGQWMNVFLDIGYITEEMLGEDFYRWLYTALTRATHRVFFINLPKEFQM
ncbi:MAG: AAA family ATPase [Massilibacteroides sp.]|nr:AAA family ATPase [Massilibacteroides sp.]MDD3062084.1 AAA family ATPase [Massilibacteroides sp.]MDD4114092.1 AAA family ATPase [Massilibacteroides sp.]MDD4659628.1 AAA family ATPase [Massilibacteroides sp.]